jgi:hypothetical protein
MVRLNAKKTSGKAEVSFLAFLTSAPDRCHVLNSIPCRFQPSFTHGSAGSIEKNTDSVLMK